MTWTDAAASPPPERPTFVRYFVVIATFLTAVLLYLDRFCMNFAQQYVKEDLGLTKQQIDWCMSAFFATYALAQVPSGGLTDRFGPRVMLTLYVLAWSFFTAAMGWVGGIVGLLLVRMAAGASQAGAYPTAARIVGHWVPLGRRGLASSAIALGGRVGGAAAPVLTALLVIAFVPSNTSPLLTSDDVLDAHFLGDQLRLSESEAAEAHAATQEARTIVMVAGRVYQGLPAETRAVVDSLATRYAADEEIARSPSREFGGYDESVRRRLDPASAGDVAIVVEGLNQFVNGPLPAPAAELAFLPLEGEAKWLRNRGDQLTTEDRARLNRLILEAVFPNGVRKIYVQGWRPVMLVYGAAGLLVAGWYFVQVRNSPDEHPRVNALERDLIDAGRPAAPRSQDAGQATAVPMRAILRNRSLWLLNVAQFGTNIGWVFLVTLLDRYLVEVHRVPYVDRSWMEMIPIFVGWGGMLSGGWITDRLTRGLGLRAGRALPVGLSRFVAMGAFLLLLLEPSPWTCTLLFSVVAFGTDLGSPAVWAYYQDVGGRSIAAVLGWGNMWGNFGATVSPLLIGWIAREWSWNAAFATCAAAFLLAGVCGLAIDASRPIVNLTSSSDAVD